MEKITVELDRDVALIILDFLAKENERCNKGQTQSSTYNLSSYYGNRAYLLGENLARLNHALM